VTFFNIKFFRVLSLVFSLFQVVSCALPQVTPESGGDPTAPPMKNLLQLQSSVSEKVSKKKVDNPEVVPEGLTFVQPDMDLQSADNGPKLTLSARDVDVKTVLFAISSEISQNVVIDPTIESNVTVDLKDVSLETALSNILKPLHLKYVIDGKTITIGREELETRIFQLDYVISQRTGLSNMNSSSGNGRSGQTSASSGSTGTSGSGRSTSSVRSTEIANIWNEVISNLKKIVTRSKSSNSSNSSSSSGNSSSNGTSGTSGTSGLGGSSAATGLLSSLSGSGSGGSSTLSAAGIGGGLASSTTVDETAEGEPNKPYFTANKQAGLIIVRDYPDVLLRVAEMLEVVEGSAQRQVFIQAKILEVTLKDEYRLGIDWSKISPLTIASSTEGAGTFLGSLKNATLTGSSPFTFGLANANFSLIVSALSQQGEVNVLSNPKIATLNNQRAVIKVGTEDVFFLPQTTAATTTTAAVTTFTVESVTIGIVLDVVPQISSDGDIMMSINTSITEQNGTRTTPDGITSVPILDIREASNVVLAENGQTIVLGGLMKTKSEDKDNSVPLLGEIPIVGRLFQSKDRTNEKSELIIMLTPQIMVGKAVDEEKAKQLAMLGKRGITEPNDPPWGPKSRMMR